MILRVTLGPGGEMMRSSQICDRANLTMLLRAAAR